MAAETVTPMFDRIAHRYDLLNRLLSFGQDQGWRRRVLQFLPPRRAMHVLDMATGTGDLAMSMVQYSPAIGEVVGLDLSGNMLEIGKRKVLRAGQSGKITLQKGDAMAIPFADESFDAVTIAFGIRNVVDCKAALSEMYRVLKPSGRVIVLEFSLPENALLRCCYLFYFRHVLPVLGGFISGNKEAYRYLNQSVEHFPYGARFVSMMRTVGFHDVQCNPLTFGVASIYCGEKGDRP